MTKPAFELAQFLHLLPIAIPAAFGVVVLILDLYLKRGGSKTPLALMTALACGLSAFSARALWSGLAETQVLGGALSVSATASRWMHTSARASSDASSGCFGSSRLMVAGTCHNPRLCVAYDSYRLHSGQVNHTAARCCRTAMLD